jgi:hypothetical protein
VVAAGDARDRLMEGQAMAEETRTAWQCPKDGTAMQPLGRRAGAYRCPDCRGVFIDTDAMRRRRGRRAAVMAPIVSSVLMSLLATFVVRRLRRRREASAQP